MAIFAKNVIMRLRISLLVLSFFLTTSIAFADWGKTGHRATGEIATSYLTPEALAAVNEILDFKSLQTLITKI